MREKKEERTRGRKGKQKINKGKLIFQSIKRLFDLIKEFLILEG